MEKDRKKPTTSEPLPEVVARDDVRVSASPTRCPYCHTDVTPEANDWIACKACLARHHAACWQESRGCGTCRETVALAAQVIPHFRPVLSSSAARRSNIGGVGLGVFLMVSAIAFAVGALVVNAHEPSLANLAAALAVAALLFAGGFSVLRKAWVLLSQPASGNRTWASEPLWRWPTE